MGNGIQQGATSSAGQHGTPLTAKGPSHRGGAGEKPLTSNAFYQHCMYTMYNCHPKMATCQSSNARPLQNPLCNIHNPIHYVFLQPNSADLARTCRCQREAASGVPGHHRQPPPPQPHYDENRPKRPDAKHYIMLSSIVQGCPKCPTMSAFYQGRLHRAAVGHIAQLWSLILCENETQGAFVVLCFYKANVNATKRGCFMRAQVSVLQKHRDAVHEVPVYDKHTRSASRLKLVRPPCPTPAQLMGPQELRVESSKLCEPHTRRTLHYTSCSVHYAARPTRPHG